MANSIIINRHRLVSVESAWHTNGKWMVVWDNGNAAYLRKVYCVLPPILGVEYPVYALSWDGSYGYGCWSHAAYIPEGADLCMLDGYAHMKKEMDNEKNA